MAISAKKLPGRWALTGPNGPYFAGGSTIASIVGVVEADQIIGGTAIT
jgi:hypothetical protein